MSARVISHYLQLLLKLYLPSGRSTSQTGVRECTCKSWVVQENSHTVMKLHYLRHYSRWNAPLSFYYKLFGTSRSMGKFRNIHNVVKTINSCDPPPLSLYYIWPDQTHISLHWKWTNHQACWCPEAACSQHTIFTWAKSDFLLESTLKLSVVYTRSWTLDG